MTKKLCQIQVETHRVAGVILCGGRSRRMGGPKAWLTLGPEFFLERVVRILKDVVDPIVVVAAEGQDLPVLPESVVIVRDHVPERGPLQGLATGLEALTDDIELAYLSATDAPLINLAHIERLFDRIGEADLILPEIGGFLHPLAALYRRRTVLPEVNRLLEAGRGRMLDLIDRVNTIRLDASQLADLDPNFSTLRNVNTLEEYEALLRDFRSDE